MSKTKLQLEVNTKFIEQGMDIATGVKSDPNRVVLGNAVLLVSPLNLDKDYWQFRVKLGNKGQAIVGLPKFGVIGIGFAKETDWNTNLPSDCKVDEIFNHIARNKGDSSILDSDVKIAIGMVQKAAKRWEKYQRSLKLKTVWEKEPFMRSGDKLMTLKEFEQRCYVLRASRMDTITLYGGGIFPNRDIKVRKCVVLFGVTESPYSWKYKFKFYCKGKKDALKRAYQAMLNLHARNEINLRFPSLEEVNTEYNGKVPIYF